MGKTDIHIRTHYKVYNDSHKIAVCGNIEELGMWVAQEGVIGEEYPIGSGWWCVTFKLEEERDATQPVTFKLVHLYDDGDVMRVIRWQGGPDRVLPLYENVFCAWAGMPYPDNILDIDLGPNGNPCVLTSPAPGEKFSKAPLFTLLGGDGEQYWPDDELLEEDFDDDDGEEAAPPVEPDSGRQSRLSRASRQSQQKGELEQRSSMDVPDETFRPSLTTAEPYMAEGITRQEVAAMYPGEPDAYRQSRVSRVSRQSEMGDSAEADPTPGVEGDVGGGQLRCRKCDRCVRCEKCEGETEMCEDCMIDNACTCVHSEMDEFGMGGYPRDYVIYSQQGRPSSGSRSPGSVAAPRPPSGTRPTSGTRPRSGTLSGTNVRPTSNSAINAQARQSIRPGSGVRSSRPVSAEGRRDTSGMPSVEVPTIEVPDGDEFTDSAIHNASSQTDRVWISDGEVPVTDLPDNCYYNERIDLRAVSSQTEDVQKTRPPITVREVDTTSDHFPPSLMLDPPLHDSLAHKSSQTTQNRSTNVDSNAQTTRASKRSMSTQRPSLGPSVEENVCHSSVTPINGWQRQSSVKATKQPRESNVSGVKGGASRKKSSAREKNIKPSKDTPLMANTDNSQVSEVTSQCCNVM